MNISKRTLTIVGAAIGALLILLAYGMIVRTILAGRTQQAAIEDQIAVLEPALAVQQGGAQALPARQAELATLQAELEAAQFAFPSEVESTEVLAHIFATATDHSVDLRMVQARDPVTSTLGVATYSIFAYDVEVEGDLTTIATFLSALESGAIETLTLDQIHLEAQEMPPVVYRAALVAQIYVRQNE